MGDRKMKKTPKRSAVTVSVAAFVILLVGVVLFTGVLPGLRAEKEESAAAPPDGAGYEAAIAVPAAQEDKADGDAAEPAAASEQGRIDESEQREADLAAAYREAEELLAAGSREAAYKAFMALGDYRDSKQRADAIYESVTGRDALAKASVGDTVVFGTYEQDGNRANGPEWIEWLVLDKEEDRLLVISKYGLSSQAYNTTNISITWGHCTLRDFLNRRFLQDAFSEEEQARIPTLTVRAEQNPFFDTDSGKDTQDKVFLLSIEEADRYFSSDEARRCIPTPLTEAQGACVSITYESDGRATCWWWLRQPGRRNNLAACIDDDGSIHPSGYDNNLDDVAVRPAMWIETG